MPCEGPVDPELVLIKNLEIIGATQQGRVWDDNGDPVLPAKHICERGERPSVKNRYLFPVRASRPAVWRIRCDPSNAFGRMRDIAYIAFPKIRLETQVGEVPASTFNHSLRYVRASGVQSDHSSLRNNRSGPAERVKERLTVRDLRKIHKRSRELRMQGRGVDERQEPVLPFLERRPVNRRNDAADMHPV